MKKKGRFFIFIPLLFFLLSLPTRALSDEDIERFSKFDSIYDALPDGITREEMETLSNNQEPEYFWDRIGDWIGEAFHFGIRENLKLLALLCVFLLAGSFFESIKESFSPGLAAAFPLLFLFAAALPSLQSVNEAIKTVGNALSGTANFMLATLPVSTMLLSMCGAVSTSALQGFSLTFVLSAFSTLLYSHLFPLVRTLFCFSFLEGAGGGFLSGISKLIQKTVKTLCIFFFLLATTLIAIRHALSAAADSVAMRSVRFAAGTFIPVVGSALGEQSRVLFASLYLIKNKSGVIFLSVLLFLLIRPILFLYFRKLVFSLSAATAQILGVDSLKKFFQSIAQIMDLMQALVLTQGCYLIFCVTLMLHAKGGM